MTKLEVAVHRQGTRYVATTEVPGKRTLSIHRFEHDPTGLTRLGPVWLLEHNSLHQEDQAILSRFKRRETSAAQVAQYGYRLFQYLFGDGEVLDAYLQEQADPAPLQLVINLSSDAVPLWRLPWEYLHDGRHFLLRDDRIRLIRCLDACSTRTLQPTPTPLRVLVVIPAPEDHPVLNYQRELTAIQEALSESTTQGNVLLHVLFEATRPTLHNALQREDYQILHYLGQATYDLEQRQGLLKIENETGMSEWIGARSFTDLIKGRGLRLMVLQAYQNAPVGMVDAFNEIAIQALRREIPEILTVPVGLPSASSQALQQRLYSALGDGLPTIAAVHQARITLHNLDRDRNPKQRRFDWGVPMFYSRVEPYGLIRQDASRVPHHEDNFSRYVTPPIVNRTQEIRVMRTALQEGTRTFYLWGGAGVGKSKLIHHLLQQPGIRLQDHLVIHCSELEDPLLALNRLAAFWRAHASESHIRAAELLLDSTKDPFERALQAQAYLADAQYIIVFEDLDIWFDTPQTGDGEQVAPGIAHDLLRNLLMGILNAEANTSYIFTGKQRWGDLNALPVEHRREIHLPLLQEHHAIQWMNTLLGLSRKPYKVKKALYWLMGGHPETLVLASGWATAGYSLRALITAPPIEERDIRNWIEYFTRELIHHLDPGERQILEAAAILIHPFTAQQLAELTSIASHHGNPMLDVWLDLGLVERVPGAGKPRYRFHQLVKGAILKRLTAKDRHALHRRAAYYYGSPFLDEARRQALIRSGTVWSDSRVAWLARDSNGILGLWLRRESDPQLQKQILARALSWHYHLLQAGALKEASQIAHTLAPMLDQQGQRDLSRLLLQRAITDADEMKHTENLDTLAKLRLQDGHLQSALEVYAEVVASLRGNKNKVQQAYILIRAGKIRQQMSEYQEAVKHYQQALKLMRDENNTEGEAQALHSLSTIYRETGNARQALVYSQAAMECYQLMDHRQGLALIHYEQGLALKALSRNESALDRFTTSLEIARQLGDQMSIASTLMQIGEILQKLDQEDMAIRTLEEAANHYARLQNPREQEVLARLESIYAQQARFEEAVTQFREAKKKPET